MKKMSQLRKRAICYTIFRYDYQCLRIYFIRKKNNVTFFTNVFLFIMYQSNIALNMGRYEHIKAVENKKCHAYARLHSNLYKEGVDACDAEEIAKVKAVGRKTMSEWYSSKQ
jgi:hypothetical protein